jgi:hypothetical protein
MDIKKLPKWAQKEFEKLERERFVAVRALREYTDNQTPSAFFIDEYESTGDSEGARPASYTRYIQTHRITVLHEGVRLSVYLRDRFIDLQWEDSRRTMTEIACVPESYQKMRLVSKENMR